MKGLSKFKKNVISNTKAIIGGNSGQDDNGKDKVKRPVGSNGKSV